MSESTAVDSLAWHFAKAEAQAHLDEAVKQLAQLGLASSAVLLEGGAAQRIVEYAHKHNTDLLVLSSHGQGGLSGWNVSGVAQKVIHRAGTSIMLVRSSDESAEERRGVSAEIIQYHHILVPLDGSQRAESALPLASALAERHSAELLVVHVAARPEMIQRVPLSPEDVALAERVVARNTTEAEKYFANCNLGCHRRRKCASLSTMSVTRALHNLVEQEHVDLVVLSAHGHSCHSQWPYSALVNSFITYGATSLLILQDLPSNETRRGDGRACGSRLSHANQKSEWRGRARRPCSFRNLTAASPAQSLTHSTEPDKTVHQRPLVVWNRWRTNLPPNM